MASFTGMMYHQPKFGYTRFMLSGQTLIKILNICCDLDLEHSNPVSSMTTNLWLMTIYHPNKFGCRKITKNL